MKDKIESTGQSVIKLKRLIENGTCPPDVRYDAKANMFPDEDFKGAVSRYSAKLGNYKMPVKLRET